MSRRAWLLLALAVAGCGAAPPDRPLVIVDVAGSRNGAATVGTLPILNGVQAQSLTWLPPGSSELDFELPLHARGDLQIAAAGFDAAQCIVSFGQIELTVSSDDVVHAPVTLQAQAPKCN